MDNRESVVAKIFGVLDLCAAAASHEIERHNDLDFNGLWEFEMSNDQGDSQITLKVQTDDKTTKTFKITIQEVTG